MSKTKTIIINAVGLSPYLLEHGNIPNLRALMDLGTYRPMDPGFPALTCPVQSSITTGKPPTDHGITGNGYFDRLTKKPEFWRQESGLVQGPCIWDWLKEKDPEAKVAVLFWQNSKFIDADIVLTPAPMHTDHGMIEWCYSKPRELYKQLTDDLGEFRLSDYWGPAAGVDGCRGSWWIKESALRVLQWHDPDMLLMYIPHLDYVSQKAHPQGEEVFRELERVDELIGEIRQWTEQQSQQYRLIVHSEYGLSPVQRPVHINLALRDAGYLRTMEVQGKEYIDYELSDAFALVDHQVAYVYCNKRYIEEVRALLSQTDGVSTVLDGQQQKEYGVSHSRNGELVVLAETDAWFAYYFWRDETKKPFYAHDVDIHNKPGYDPCEMFSEERGIAIEPERIRGSHGLPARDDTQYAVFICTDTSIEDYAPRRFHVTHIFPMLHRML